MIAKKKERIEEAFQIDEKSGLAPDYRNALQIPFTYVNMASTIDSLSDPKKKAVFENTLKDIANAKLVTYEQKYSDLSNVVNEANKKNVKKLNSVMKQIYDMVNNKSSDYRKIKELMKEAEDIIVPDEDHSSKYLNN